MAFMLGDLLVDRILYGIGENSKGELLYTLTNLQEATIDISADSTDAVDGTGAVIKTFYKAKTGTFTGTNSTISLPIIATMSGTDPIYASSDSPLSIPHIVMTASATVTLPGVSDAGTDNNIRVYSVAPNGTLGKAYAVSTGTTSAGQYSVASGKMTITPNDGDTKWIIKYDRKVTENAVEIKNRSDAFAKSHKLTLKVLIVDPCETDTVRAAYVVLPSFQPSPEVSIGFTTDGTIDLTGNLQTSYCGTDKVLYEIYMAEDDIEEDA